MIWFFCACDFSKKEVTVFTSAALEHYLKNDEEGQVILQSLEKGHEEQEEVSPRLVLVVVLERIQPQKREKIYTLSAQGQVEAGTTASFGLSNRFSW